MDDNNIITNADGTIRAKNPSAWDHLPDVEKAAMIAQDQARWQNAYTGAAAAASTGQRRAETPAPKPRPFDDQDRSIRLGNDGAGFVDAETLRAMNTDSWK